MSAIQHSSERMNSLIQDLVDAARSKGQLDLDLSPIVLREFLPRFLECTFLKDERDRVRMTVHHELTVVKADPGRLERILVNLISNALKYSSEEVICQVIPSESGVLFSVQDTGTGIPSRDLPHIFEQFFRVGRNRKNKEGVGLGLYIVRILVEAHGGRIWVESREGKGSTFFFTIPR